MFLFVFSASLRSLFATPRGVQQHKHTIGALVLSRALMIKVDEEMGVDILLFIKTERPVVTLKSSFSLRYSYSKTV